MRNKAMQRKLENGDAIDISKSLRVGSDGAPTSGYDITERAAEIEGKDICDAELEEWMWSVGKFPDGKVIASTDGRFYQNPDCECLWLR